MNWQQWHDAGEIKETTGNSDSFIDQRDTLNCTLFKVKKLDIKQSANTYLQYRQKTELEDSAFKKTHANFFWQSDRHWKQQELSQD